MNFIRAFLWFCKEQEIMDSIHKIFKDKRMHYDKTSNKSKNTTNSDIFNLINYYIRHYGFFDVFWHIQGFRPQHNEKYLNARKKWNGFVRNNLRFSEDFIKIGDEIEVISNSISENKFSGIITNIYNPFDGTIDIEKDGIRMKINLCFYDEIIVNGEKREPKFYIKRKREKYYGAC